MTRSYSFALFALLASCGGSTSLNNTPPPDASDEGAADVAAPPEDRGTPPEDRATPIVDRVSPPEDTALPPDVVELDAGPPVDVLPPPMDVPPPPMDVVIARDVPVATDVSADAPVTPGDIGPLGMPITAPNEQWTWVPFTDARCGNGQPTGIGVNLTNRSRRVVFFFNGGGACWDALTCYVLNTAVNVSAGYTEASFRSESANLNGFFLFDRNNTNNPWRDASFVFVPYCTGDIHGGDRVVTYELGGQRRETSHVGYRNVSAYLRRLVPTFPMADRVLVTGASAGGYGASINWEHIADAFPRARVDMIDDSGPPIQPSASQWNSWRTSWNLQLPPGCTSCATDLGSIIPYYARRFPPPARFALLSYTQDSTISGYYLISGAQFEMQLNALATTRFDPTSNGRYFFVTGNRHVLWTNVTSIQASNGTRLATWLQQFDRGDPMWRSVRP